LRSQESGYDDYHNLSRQFVGSEAIATTSGQNDSGLFQISFQDERFIPFEFSGAVSRWRIEIPPQNNQFDLETVTDLVMHLNHTAREGGAMLRRAADESAQRHLPGGGVRFFDVRHEFPDSWNQVFHPDSGMPAGRRRDKKDHDFALRSNRRMFPFLTGRRTVTITSIHSFIEPEYAPTVGEHISFQFIPGEHCNAENRAFTCVVSADKPCFYHGTLDVKIDPLVGDDFNMFGVLRFPESFCRAGVRQVYFLCHYAAHDGTDLR
jgi:SAM-dependent methyltransferase